MNPHAEAADHAIRRLASAIESTGPGSADLAHALARACDDLLAARQMRGRRMYAKAERRAARGLASLGMVHACPAR